jgi:hypothetical protein
MKNLLKLFWANEWRGLCISVPISAMLPFLIYKILTWILIYLIPVHATPIISNLNTDTLYRLYFVSAYITFLFLSLYIFWVTAHKKYKTFDVIWSETPPKSKWDKSFLFPFLMYYLPVILTTYYDFFTHPERFPGNFNDITKNINPEIPLSINEFLPSLNFIVEYIVFFIIEFSVFYFIYKKGLFPFTLRDKEKTGDSAD